MGPLPSFDPSRMAAPGAGRLRPSALLGPLRLRALRALSWSYRTGRLALGLFLLYALLFNVSVVRGNSMAPGIRDGDRILVQPWSLLLGGVDRGDVVVLRYPLDPNLDYIKRVVGLPGDQVVMEAGSLWVNGERVEEGYVQDPDREIHLRTEVKPGHYFVLGDNRRRSSDSREFGQVPDGHLRGVVAVRLWPPARLGLID